MTKEQVERLLRFGAYDFFTEDENGISEKETIDFFKEDIDSILKSRTKKVNCSAEYKELPNNDSPFSKTNLNLARGSKASDIDVDVDDPDFWRKIISNVETNVNEEPNGSRKNDYAYSTRQRKKRVNYSEQDYFDNILGTVATPKKASETKETTSAIKGATLATKGTIVVTKKTLA